MDKELEQIYLDWHDGRRPYSGYLKDIQALITHKQDEAERRVVISTLNLLNGTTVQPGDPVTKTVAYLHSRLKELQDKNRA